MPNIAKRVVMDGKINLENVFRRRLIIDMQTLQRLCKGRSKRSLFRDLSLLGYFSSYSHAGKYYTLTNIPNFDECGLWHYKDVSFSKNGVDYNDIYKGGVKSPISSFFFKTNII